MQARIMREAAEELDVGDVLDVDDAAETAGEVLLRMLIVVAPLVAAGLVIVNDIRAQVAVLHIRRRTVADIDAGAVVALVVDVSVQRRVGGVAERNEVAELETIAERPSEEDARNEKSLRAVALGRPYQSRRAEQRPVVCAEDDVAHARIVIERDISLRDMNRPRPLVWLARRERAILQAVTVHATPL